jgi:hypothetical protein
MIRATELIDKILDFSIMVENGNIKLKGQLKLYPKFNLILIVK